MNREQAARLAAFILFAAAAGGCGGGGDGAAPGFTESRTFDFTVTVGGARGQLQNVEFFTDETLSQRGVRVESQSRVIATPGASVTGQQSVAPVGDGFALAVHFDASGSIDDPGRDPNPPKRFNAARFAIGEVGARAAATDTRIFTFRFTSNDPDYANNRFKQVAGPFDASNSSARDAGLAAAQAQGASGNSPALSATINIIGALPTGQPHAMLLLTDGENNSEDPRLVATHPCGSNQETTQGCSDDIQPVVNVAGNRNVKIFVAGLGNEDSALAKFRELARQTGGAFVKVTRAEELQAQFSNIGALMVDGGVVVSGRTDPVEVVVGGNPFIRGVMRYTDPSTGQTKTLPF